MKSLRYLVRAAEIWINQREDDPFVDVDTEGVAAFVAEAVRAYEYALRERRIREQQAR